jgi:cob(I)alamin adenosyltransferase
MPRITRVYTRTGDDGTTAVSGGHRVAKDDLRIEAYGTVDELNAAIGVAVAAGPAGPLVEPLADIRNRLFHLGAELSVLEEDAGRLAGPRIEARDAEGLERLMDRLSETLPPLENFVLPGGTPAAAHLHMARTVCRRAERLLVSLAARDRVRSEGLVYLNRLSDALFVMARYENAERGVEDVLWNSRA